MTLEDFRTCITGISSKLGSPANFSTSSYATLLLPLLILTHTSLVSASKEGQPTPNLRNFRNYLPHT
jgi:hypothetical protein